MDRGDRRERNRRKPDILAAARLAAVVLLVGQCLRVAFTSPRLRLRSVSVAGTSRLAPDDVMRLAGVARGQNIFSVNLVAVSERLLANPVIERAEVTRDLPDSLRVDVDERRPALIVESRNGRFHADAAGVVFERAASPSSLPVLVVPPEELPAPGGRLRPELVEALSECRRLAAAEGLGLRYVRVDGAGELWLNIGIYPTRQSTAGRLKVRVGRAAELEEKFRDIRQSLRGWPELAASAAHLDVMCPGRPAYLNSPENEDVQDGTPGSRQRVASGR